MRRTVLLPTALILALLVWTGCASTKPAEETDTKPAADAPLQVGGAFVFVDGVQKGVTPTTVRVRRSFGERLITVSVHGEPVRVFEVEQVTTADGNSLTYSFWGDQDTGMQTFDVSVLPTDGKKGFVIPYSPGPIKIEDRQYNLTLIVIE